MNFKTNIRQRHILKKTNTQKKKTKKMSQMSHGESRKTARDLVTDWKEDFFTKPEIVEMCAEIAKKYVDDYPGLVYIDSSAGKNEFAVCLCEDTDVEYMSFDIYKYPETEGEVTKQNWLTVKPEQLPKDDVPIAIGFNPPFGRKSKLLNEFMVKACSFHPELIFLLCPSKYKLPKEERVWYDELENVELPPFSFYKSSQGSDSSIWQNPHIASKFLVLHRRDEPKELDITQTKHPKVTMMKVSKLPNPDKLESPNDTLIVRVTGNLAGHSFFVSGRNGLDEYREEKYLGNWKNWSATGYSGTTYDCLIFERPHPPIKQLQKSFLNQWRKMMPSSFVPNTSSFSITRGQMCEMFDKIL